MIAIFIPTYMNKRLVFKIVDMKWWLVGVFSLQLNLACFLHSFMVLEFKKKFTVLDLRLQFDHNGPLDSQFSMFVRLNNA